jgi:hypothetical protein
MCHFFVLYDLRSYALKNYYLFIKTIRTCNYKSVKKMLDSDYKNRNSLIYSNYESFLCRRQERHVRSIRTTTSSQILTSSSLSSSPWLQNISS